MLQLKRRINRWLCPTALDRARVAEANDRVRTLRFTSLAALALALAIAVPWQGPLYLMLALPVALLFVGVDLTIGKVRFPALLSASAIVATLGILACGIALNGGAKSAALPWLVLPLGTAAARFRAQVVVAALLLTVVAVLAATFGPDPDATVKNPVPVIATVGLAVSVLAIVWAIQAAELQNREAAVHDPLTALLNRSSLPARFREIAHQAKISRRPVSLLMLDLDDFKDVNDNYGHQRGDQLLCEVATALRGQLRSFELVYRMGGDEFLVVLPGLALSRAKELGHRFCRALEAAKPAGLTPTVSVGVACAVGEEVELERLYRAADDALYAAKRAGGNTVCTANRGEVVAEG